MSVECLISDIRGMVNKPQLHRKFRRDHALFCQLCSAMDMVSDTDLAIKAYKSNQFKDLDVLYLVTIGVLQAMVVQQDAVKHVCNSLEVDELKERISNDEQLRQICETRNYAIGHPARKDRGLDKKNPKFSHISRVSLEHGSFELFIEAANGTNEYRYVDINKLIVDQESVLVQVMGEIISFLKAELAE